MKKNNDADESLPEDDSLLDQDEEFKEGSIEEENPFSLSALQLFDRIAKSPLLQTSDWIEFKLLRDRIEEMEEIQDQARSAVEQLSEAVDKLRAPALRLGTLIQRVGHDRAMVCANGTDYLCNVDPSLPEAVLETGMRVLLNEAFAITDSFGLDKSGPIVCIQELMSDGRIRVGSEHGMADITAIRSSLLNKEKLKIGMDVRLDPNQKVVVEIIGQSKRIERSLATVEPVPWEAVGGQEEAIEAIRDSIELPFLHAHLYKQYNHPAPKGFLLHGPPGCGKTLMGKATAHNLRQQVLLHSGENRQEFFLHVKGPEILNMWLGESERQVRDLFAQCREKASEGQLAFLFIDEAESILGTRGAFRSGNSIVSTLVPMFCAEMDGIEALNNVVVILASNRADLIDPAILRPGRIDRKVGVKRPNSEAAREIYGIYLNEALPMAEPRDKLIDGIVNVHYAKSESNRFLEVTYRSGKREHLYRGDLSSGAVIAAIVERTKGIAIKRTIKEGNDTPSPITSEDLLQAFDKEYQENELFPPTDITEDWLKLTDFDPSNIVSLNPYRRKTRESHGSSV